MKNLFGKFFKEEEGSIIEYVILIAVIAVIIAILFPILKGKMGDWFSKSMNNTDCGIGSGSGVSGNINMNNGVTAGSTTEDLNCAP